MKIMFGEIVSPRYFNNTSWPRMEIEKCNDKEIWEKIRNMSNAEWKAMGHIKGSLWYLKHNIDSGSFKIYRKIERKLTQN